MSVHFALFTLYLAAMHSTSTNAPLGNAFTATAERAGKGCAKNSAYTSFISAGLFFHATWHEFARRYVYGKLSRGEYKTVSLDGLTVRTDGLGCFFCVDCFHLC